MRHFNTYKELDEDLFFFSQLGGVIQISPNGRDFACLLKDEEGYILERESTFSFDLLVDFEFIRQKIQSMFYLMITFQNGYFRAYLMFKRRIGGYQEPEAEFVFASSKGHSIKESLFRLNKKIASEFEFPKDLKEDKIVNLALVRKKINKNREDSERDLYEYKGKN